MYICSIEADTETTTRACGAYLRVHFKQMREVGHACKGMPLLKAIKFLEDVLQKKQAVPFLRFTGGGGRHAQGKLRNTPGDKVRWPVKATKVVLGLLKNCVANAEVKRMEIEDLTVSHVQANRAPKMRRRTYRAHGRIGAYKCSPAHFEVICSSKGSMVEKPVDDAVAIIPSRKQLAQKRVRLTMGGGI